MSADIVPSELLKTASCGESYAISGLEIDWIPRIVFGATNPNFWRVGSETESFVRRFALSAYP